MPVAAIVAVLSVIVVPVASASPDEIAAALAGRPLDGAGNNVAHPDWGQVGEPYLRVAPAAYADGIGTPVAGPPTRYVSNRIFADYAQNLFSENGVTQWGFVWGQFLDHTFGLREEAGGERAPIAFDAHDPLEALHATTSARSTSRARPPRPGTGVAGVPREQINTVSSLHRRLGRLRRHRPAAGVAARGPVNGDLATTARSCCSTRRTAAAPRQPRQRRHRARDGAPGRASPRTPQKAMVAGDVRANENIALTATQTLFAREHNRIVDALPAGLPEELKFQIARRIVSAEQQYITYSEFLPALGVRLPRLPRLRPDGQPDARATSSRPSATARTA